MVFRAVVGDHRHPLEAARASGQGVQHAAVVQVVARVGADQQRVLHAMAVHHLLEAGLVTDFPCPLGPVGHIVRIRKTDRVEQVAVGVDLGFLEDLHGIAVVENRGTGVSAILHFRGVA